MIGNTFHCSLESIDWIYLTHQYPSTKRPQTLSTTFTYISIACYYTYLKRSRKLTNNKRSLLIEQYSMCVNIYWTHLSCQHNVSSSFNTINQWFSASIKVVKLALITTYHNQHLIRRSLHDSSSLTTPLTHLSYRVVHIECWHFELTLFQHFSQIGNTSCGFFRQTNNTFYTIKHNDHYCS